MFKAVVFDIGQTLVEYHKPLNWSALYRPALEQMAAACHLPFAEADYRRAIDVLTRYNTRIHPRDYEVSSTQIFTELLADMQPDGEGLAQAKCAFYSYFKREAAAYPDAKAVLKTLADRGILLGTLSDVAYGMDNEFALEEIAPLAAYIGYPMTSNDVGFRKPSPVGLKRLAEQMGIEPAEMIFVGDEEKDMVCANNAGAYSVLINRGGEKRYGQRSTIRTLGALLPLVWGQGGL